MKNTMTVGAMLLLTLTAHAEIACRTTCSAKTQEIISEYAKNGYYDEKYESFKANCGSLGGTIVTTGDNFVSDADKLGCLESDGRSVGTKHFVYCVKEKVLTGTGYGNTHVSKNNGGLFSASHQAQSSCRKNVTLSSCVGEITSTDYQQLSINCQEL